ncbi:hypothetical protein JCM1840_006670 [Sporobolomyces johnsonii]
MLARLGRPRAARVASAAPLFRTVQPTLAPRSAHSSLLPLSRQFHLSRRLQRPIKTSVRKGVDPTHCPSCSAPVLTFAPFCPFCSSLLPALPPQHRDHFFDLFGLPTSYAIDSTQAAHMYTKLQEKLRPELFSGQGERKEWAKGWRRQVMLSYAALTSDTTRGDFLFKEVCGITIDWGKVYPAQHPELHAEYCKIQAALESATSEDDVDAIRDAIWDDIESTNASLATAFSTILASSPDNRDVLPAYNLYVRRQYLRFSQWECDEWALGYEVNLLSCWDQDEV